MPLEGPSLAIFVVSVAMMALSAVTVLLRTFVRLYILRAFGCDDVLMLAALVGYPWTRQRRSSAHDVVGFICDIECVLFHRDNERGRPLKDRFHKHGSL
jgi:hypothetical protein